MYQVTIKLTPPDREPIVETINVDSLQIAGYREAASKGLFTKYHERRVRPVAPRLQEGWTETAVVDQVVVPLPPSQKGSLNGSSQGFSLMR